MSAFDVRVYLRHWSFSSIEAMFYILGNLAVLGSGFVGRTRDLGLVLAFAGSEVIPNTAERSQVCGDKFPLRVVPRDAIRNLGKTV
jgi:hypothetical protein